MKKIFLLILSLLLCGCGNYSELNKLSIVTAVALDKNDDKYEVSFLIANSPKAQTSSKEGEAKTTVYSGTGKTIPEAAQSIDQISPKKLYFGHINVVVISEDIVKKMTTNYKSFNFVNLIVNDTRSMANDKAILLKKYTDLVKDNKMTKEEYMKEVWGLKGQSRKQAKARILQIERNIKNDKKNNVLPFAKNFVKEKWQNVAKEMYLISSKSELA